MGSVLYDRDIDRSSLEDQKVAVLGYGSQGHAHALNLHDSGFDVRVGLRRDSKSWPKAEEDGLTVLDTADAAAEADVVMMLLPDMAQPSSYENEVRPNLRAGNMLMFAHGFNVHFGEIAAPEGVDVGMVAPKSPGHLVRRTYVEGRGTPSLFAVHADPTETARARTLAYASGIGSGRAGIIETTFAEETETDLFGEQAVLCGGTSALIKAGFETLVDAGYQPEIAYFECLHELKLIVDLLYEGGFEYMHYSISDTAEYGDFTRGPRIVTDETRAEMKRILEEITSGAFAKEWIAEAKAGYPRFTELREEDRKLRIEEVGGRLRAMMPWLRKPDTGTGGVQGGSSNERSEAAADPLGSDAAPAGAASTEPRGGSGA